MSALAFHLVWNRVLLVSAAAHPRLVGHKLLGFFCLHPASHCISTGVRGMRYCAWHSADSGETCKGLHTCVAHGLPFKTRMNLGSVDGSVWKQWDVFRRSKVKNCDVGSVCSPDAPHHLDGLPDVCSLTSSEWVIRRLPPSCLLGFLACSQEIVLLNPLTFSLIVGRIMEP